MVSLSDSQSLPSEPLAELPDFEVSLDLLSRLSWLCLLMAIFLDSMSPGERNCCSLKGEWLALKTCSSSSIYMSLMLVLEIKFSLDFFSPGSLVRCFFLKSWFGYFGSIWSLGAWSSPSNSFMWGLWCLARLLSFWVRISSEHSWDNVNSTYFTISGSTSRALINSIRF